MKSNTVTFLGHQYYIGSYKNQKREEEVRKLLFNYGESLMEAAKQAFADYAESMVEPGFRRPTEGQDDNYPLEVYRGSEAFGGDFILVDGWQRFLSEFIIEPTMPKFAKTYILRSKNREFFAFAKYFD